MIHAVLFDIDGTLLDTQQFIFQAFFHSLEVHNLPSPSTEQLSDVMGLPLAQVYQAIAPGFSVSDLSLAHRSFQTENMHLVMPFPHTLDVLQRLRRDGIVIAAVTTRQKHVLASLAHTGLEGHLDTVITGDDVTEHKPDPAALRLALARLEVPANEAVMIGDTWVDIQAGKNTGVKTIAVTYGFSTEASLRLRHPDAVVNDISEIPDIISSW